jgi:hypothetical protein
MGRSACFVSLKVGDAHRPVPERLRRTRALPGGFVTGDLRLEPQVGDDGVEDRLRHQESTGVIEVGDPPHAWRVAPGSLDVDQGAIPPSQAPGGGFARVVRGR